MSDDLSILATRKAADAGRSTYVRALAINLLAQSAFGVALVVAPESVVSLFGIEGDPAWPRLWGALLILVALLQIPGYLDPVNNRLINVIGIAGHALMALVYLSLSGGFLWFAAFEAVFALVLGILYRRLIIAELQSRP